MNSTPLHYLVALTDKRERPLVDAALLSALVDLLSVRGQPPAMQLYRCQQLGRKRLLLLAARNIQTDIVCEEQELNDADIDRGLRCALESGVPSSFIQRQGRHIRSTHWIPLLRESLQFGCLEISLTGTLNKQALGLLEGVCGLYCNYLSLLDYSQVDTLTRLLNRKTFDENLHGLLNTPLTSNTREAERRSAHSATANWLLVADLDHFKQVNDTHGHLAGDRVLLAVADIMRRQFRNFDKLFRFGGEEFVITLRDATKEHAIRACERFRAAVETHHVPDIGRITISVGLTRVLPGDNPTLLLGRADSALYEAKRSGRNRVVLLEEMPAQLHAA